MSMVDGFVLNGGGAPPVLLVATRCDSIVRKNASEDSGCLCCSLARLSSFKDHSLLLTRVHIHGKGEERGERKEGGVGSLVEG